MNKFDEVYNKIITEMKQVSKKNIIKEDEDSIDIKSLSQNDLVPIFKRYLQNSDAANKVAPDFYDTLADIFMNEEGGYERLMDEMGDECSKSELDQFIKDEIETAIKEARKNDFNEDDHTSFTIYIKKYIEFGGKITCYLD